MSGLRSLTPDLMLGVYTGIEGTNVARLRATSRNLRNTNDALVGIPARNDKVRKAAAPSRASRYRLEALIEGLHALKTKAGIKLVVELNDPFEVHVLKAGKASLTNPEGIWGSRVTLIGRPKAYDLASAMHIFDSPRVVSMILVREGEGRESTLYPVVAPGVWRMMRLPGNEAPKSVSRPLTRSNSGRITRFLHPDMHLDLHQRHFRNIGNI